MMRNSVISVFLVISLGLVGCQRFSLPDQMKTEERIETTSTKESVPPTSLVFTPYTTQTQMPTLTAVERDRLLEEMISTSIDCASPCFLGITPGKTTSDEALTKIRYYNLEPSTSVYEETSFISFFHDLPNNLRISMDLKIRDYLVESINVNLDLSPSRDDQWKDMLAYSPATLIGRYGLPSRVEFATSNGPTTFFSMLMYFECYDLIVEYYAQAIEKLDKTQSSLCPLDIKYDFLSLWMGDNPLYPPGKAISLDKISSLTISEFSKLMEEDPGNACFQINTDTLLK